MARRQDADYADLLAELQAMSTRHQGAAERLRADLEATYAPRRRSGGMGALRALLGVLR